MDVGASICEMVKRLGVPTCQLDGLYLLAIGVVATLALNILRPILKKPLEDLKPADALFVFLVSAIAIIIFFLHPAMRTPAAAIIGAIPLAVAIAALAFAPLSRVTLPSPIRLPLSKVAFALVPVCLLAGGLIGLWLGQVRITSALFVLPPRQIDLGSLDQSLPEKVFHPVRKTLFDAWPNSAPLAVLPPAASVDDFAKFSKALGNAAEAEYQDSFKRYGATDDVKYAVQSILSIKDDRLTIRPDIRLLADRPAAGLSLTAPADVEAKGPRKLVDLMALVAAYHLSWELMSREGDATANAQQQRDITTYFHTKLVTAFNEATQSDTSLPPASEELDAELRRTGCAEAACLAALVDRLKEWLDRQLTDPEKAAAGYSSIIAVTQ